MKGPVDISHTHEGGGDSHSNSRNNNHPTANSGPGNEFEEFLWMGEENLEEFDRKCEAEFQEEQFIEKCFEEMWRDEQAFFQLQDGYIPTSNSESGVDESSSVILPLLPASGQFIPNNNIVIHGSQGSTAESREESDLSKSMLGLSVTDRNQRNKVVSSNLNPNAPEFVPRGSVDHRNSVADR